MQLSSSRYADAVVLQPHGRIDHTSAAAFEAAMAPGLAELGSAGGTLVLDFSQVEYISSVGLRTLMVAAKQVREHQAQMLVAALQPVVAEIFSISRFDRVFSVTSTLDEALALCSPDARAAFGRATGPGGA